MSPAASFAKRWASDNLIRELTADEHDLLNLFFATCDQDEAEASRRARRYFTARGPGGLINLWHKRQPDSEDILSSCQDVYIVPLRARSVGGKRMTLISLPAPTACDKPVSAKALLTRWLMILDLRLRDDPTPGEEVVFIDLRDLDPGHLKNHFKGNYWKDFINCIKQAYPLRVAEVHLINAQRLKMLPMLLLHLGVYPWKRKVIHLHKKSEKINTAMQLDFFPIEGLPHEYGGKAGAMKDLNDEWTKKLLFNSTWLQTEELRYYTTQLKPDNVDKPRHIPVRLPGLNASYDMIPRSRSCKSLYDNLDEGTYGAYRTLKWSDKDGYI